MITWNWGTIIESWNQKVGKDVQDHLFQLSSHYLCYHKLRSVYVVTHYLAMVRQNLMVELIRKQMRALLQIIRLLKNTHDSEFLFWKHFGPHALRGSIMCDVCAVIPTWLLVDTWRWSGCILIICSWHSVCMLRSLGFITTASWSSKALKLGVLKFLWKLLSFVKTQDGWLTCHQNPLPHA